MGIPFEADGAFVPLEANGTGVPFEGNSDAVLFEANDARVPFEANDTGIPFVTDCAVVPFEADNVAVPIDTDGEDVRFQANCSDVRVNTDGAVVPFDFDCAGPSPDAIVAGAEMRRGVGCTASGDGPPRDAIATDARKCSESGGRTPANAADPSSSHSIAAAAPGHGRADAGPSPGAIATDAQGRWRNGRPADASLAETPIIVTADNIT